MAEPVQTSDPVPLPVAPIEVQPPLPPLPPAESPPPVVPEIAPPAAEGGSIRDWLHHLVDTITQGGQGEAHRDNLLHRWFNIDISGNQPDEYWYVVLILLLFILPQIFTRLRIPSAISTLGLGVLASMGLGLFHADATIDLMALFGIVSLFLFAGMEVDFRELGQHRKVLIVHMLVCLSALAGVAFGIVTYFDMAVQPALIIALALLTPSTGFILSSLKSFGLSEGETFQVKINAIASELLALIVLFFCVQSGDTRKLIIALGAVLGLIVALPLALWFYARFIAKYAPRSEFAYILILAILASWATKTLGAYYLLGAFITGVVAMRMRRVLPELAKREVIQSIELFASFFIPVYFFHAGLALDASYFGHESLMWGGIFLGIILPLRVAYVIGHRLPLARESFRISNRIAVTLLPTLVFTLVLTGLLRDQYPEVVATMPWLVGGLIIYTLINTLVPGLFLGGEAKAFELDHYGFSARYGAATSRQRGRTSSATPQPPGAALEPKVSTAVLAVPPLAVGDTAASQSQPMDLTPPHGGGTQSG